MFGAMPHEDVDVSGLDVLIAPDNRMITYFQGAVGCIGFLVNAGQHMHVWPRRFVVGVPLFSFDFEGTTEAPHYRVLLIFCDNLCGHEGSDVVLVANASHKIGEPFPHGVTIKLSQQCRVMKSDPSSFAFLNVVLECSCCCRCP